MYLGDLLKSLLGSDVQKQIELRITEVGGLPAIAFFVGDTLLVVVTATEDKDVQSR